MRRNLAAYRRHQVFLNYPYDNDFHDLENALHFAVVAAGLLPVCAKALSSPDRPRLDMLVYAISNCHYSAHDLSRATGEGSNNFSRMNMPIETGMAIFHALSTQRTEHRCAFFVPASHDYKVYASNLAGLDPFCHDNSASKVLSAMYEWLRQVVPAAQMIPQPTVLVQERFEDFKSRLFKLKGSNPDGTPTHDEVREVMYQVCEEVQWWDWRGIRAGKEEFPELPLAWKNL